MSLRVKVCGFAREEDALQVAALKPYAMGFNFWEGSPRYVAPAEVGRWETGADIQRVGVFVDASLEEMQQVIEEARLDVVQLHGDWETVPDVAELGRLVWKVIHLKKEQPADWQAYPVDAYLLDSYSDAMPGGTGTVVDWAQARQFVEDSTRPVYLAGGLHAGNVQEAVAQVGPAGVDSSSRLESAPGIKDIQKVREYISTCRAL